MTILQTLRSLLIYLIELINTLFSLETQTMSSGGSGSITVTQAEIQAIITAETTEALALAGLLSAQTAQDQSQATFNAAQTDLTTKQAATQTAITDAQQARSATEAAYAAAGIPSLNIAAGTTTPAP